MRERVNDGKQASYSRVDRQTFPIHCNFAKQESSLSLSLSLPLTSPDNIAPKNVFLTINFLL